MLLDLDDFTGKYELHTGMYDQAKLLEYIQIYEEQYLIDLFGATLYDEFILDLDNNNYPESPNFQKVFDPFHLDNTSNGFLTSYNTYNSVIISKGILDMLKGFIYFEYVKDTANQITSQGQKIPQGENSLTATTLYNMMYTRYWEALKTYRAIQWYIYRNQNLPVGGVLEASIYQNGSGYDGYKWVSYLEQSNVYLTLSNGTGAIIEFESWGIDGLKAITPTSIGSNYLNDFVYPLPYPNLGSIRVFTDPSGIPNNLVIEDAGSGYTLGQEVTIVSPYPILGDDNQKFEVTELGNGDVRVDSIVVNQMGKGYIVGNLFTLASTTHPNTDVLAILQIDKVTKGDFTKWNGVPKQMAYWL
jgi:hypothetical protein